MIRLVRALPLLAFAAALAGCSPGAAEPPVPGIEGARDVRGADPCTLPAPAQLADLGVAGPGTGVRSQEGPRCEWRGGSGAVFALTLFTDGDGLITLAQNSEPTTTRVRLAGFPALETFTAGGGFCQYDVGIAPDQVVIASLEGGLPDSCTALHRVVPAIVTALPP